MPTTPPLGLTHLLYSLAIIAATFISLNPEKTNLNDTFILTLRLDYLIHFSIFIAWMFLTRLAWKPSFRTNFPHAIKWLLIGIALATLTEAVQYYIPWRAFNINDLLANILGILTGSLFFLLSSRSQKL